MTCRLGLFPPGPIDCGNNGWYCRISNDEANGWPNVNLNSDFNFSGCNKNGSFGQGEDDAEDGHCHGSSNDSTYYWWIRDHWFRRYNGKVRCCCGWYTGGTQPVTQGRIANRCDYRRLVTQSENVEDCRDANEDHGLSFEGGCDPQYSDQIGSPIPEDDSVCWEIERFGNTEEGDEAPLSEDEDESPPPSEDEGEGESSQPSEDEDSSSLPSEDEGEGESTQPSEDEDSSSLPSEDEGEGDATQPSEDEDSSSLPSEDEGEGDATQPSEDEDSSSLPSEDEGESTQPSEDEDSSSLPSEDEGEGESTQPSEDEDSSSLSSEDEEESPEQSTIRPTKNTTKNTKAKKYKASRRLRATTGVNPFW